MIAKSGTLLTVLILCLSVCVEANADVPCTKQTLAEIDHLDLWAITSICKRPLYPNEPSEVVAWDLKSRIDEYFGTRRFLALGIQLKSSGAAFPDGIPDGGLVVVYEWIGGKWKYIQDYVCGDTSIVRLRAIDFTKDGIPELVADGGSGNHGRILTVHQLKGEHFAKILAIDGYGCGPEITELDGEQVIIDQEPAMENVCEACRACEGRVYRWKNGKFALDPDEFLDGRIAIIESQDTAGVLPGPSDNGYRTEQKRLLDFAMAYAAKHPRHFDAQQNAAALLIQSGRIDEAKSYISAMRAIELKSGAFECSYCDSEGNAKRAEELEKLSEMAAGRLGIGKPL